MTWAITTPDVLADRYATALEAVAFAGADGSVQHLDAHSANRVETALARTHAMSLFEVYLYQAYIAREMMVDTAVDWLPRHAAIWNVPRLSPKAAIGNGIVAATSAVTIPAGTEAQDGAGNRVATTAAVNVPAGGTATVPLQAEVAGSAANMSGGTVLDLVSTIGGVSQQQITLDQNGLAGGTDLEEIESWRSRIVEQINSPTGSGRQSDWVKWGQTAGAAFVQPYADWAGSKSVGVVILMAGPRIPTPAEVAQVQAALDIVRPVTTQVVVVPGTLRPIDHQVQLNPDSTAARAATTALLEAAFTADAQIGVPWFLDASWEAIGAVQGLTSRRLIVPGDDVVVNTTDLPVLGNVSWGAS